MKALYFVLGSWLVPLIPGWGANDLDRLGYPFNWQGEAAGLLSQIPGTTEVAGNFDKLTISRESMWGLTLTPGVYTLRTLGPEVVSQLTSKHYAIVGHLAYSNVAPGSFLELENWFPPGQPGNPEQFYFSRTLADAGPLAKIGGSEAGRDFAVPFDATGTKSPPVRLVLKLHLMGAGHLEFTNVRLVQYPEPATASATRTASTAQSVASVDKKSFALGVVTTLGALMGAFVLLAFVKSWQRFRHARELRRIASLDG